MNIYILQSLFFLVSNKYTEFLCSYMLEVPSEFVSIGLLLSPCAYFLIVYPKLKVESKGRQTFAHFSLHLRSQSIYLDNLPFVGGSSLSLSCVCAPRDECVVV